MLPYFYKWDRNKLFLSYFHCSTPYIDRIFKRLNTLRYWPPWTHKNHDYFKVSQITENLWYYLWFAGWLLKRPPGQADLIFDVFERLFPPAYTFVVQNLFPKMDLLQCNYIRQAIDLLEGLIPNKEDTKEDNKEVSRDHLEKLIIFAILWSCGAILELDDRKKVQRRIAC